MLLGVTELTTVGGVKKHVPALLLVQLITHALGKLLEVAFRLCIVRVDHDVLEVP